MSQSYLRWVSIAHLVAQVGYFSGLSSIVWLFYCVFFAIHWALGLNLFMVVDKDIEEYFKKELLLRYDAQIKELPARALLAYDQSDGSVRWWNLMSTFNMTSIMLVQYTVMIYCGWKMYMEMEEKLANFSSVMKRRNRQFLKTLILQITAPSISLFSPIIIIIYAPLLNLNVSVPFGAMLCGFTLYPAMDAIIVLTIMSEYKNAVKKLLFVRLKTLVEKLTGKESVENATR